MNKNSIRANFTGTGSKRSKKYYSDADAGKYYFKPDHSEFYGENRKRNPKGHVGKKNFVAEEPINIDVVYVPGAASVRRSTSKSIVDSIFQESSESINDILASDEYDTENKYGFSDIRKSKKSLANNKVTMNPLILHNYGGDSDITFDPEVKRAKSMFAKNKKTNSNYRHRQQFQQMGGYDAIEKELENSDISEDVRIEAEGTKSELEEILENKPHMIWPHDDNISRGKAA